MQIYTFAPKLYSIIININILYINLILFAEKGFYVMGNTRWIFFKPKHVRLTASIKMTLKIRQFAYVYCTTKYNIFNILTCNIIVSTYEINLLLSDLIHAA